MNTEPASSQEKSEFSLVLGGPLYQILLRAGLIEHPLGRVHKRILLCLFVTWVPLAILTAFAGTFVGGVKVPFLFDLANVRFLVGLPLFIAAEPLMHLRMRSIVEKFLDMGLIAAEDRPRLEAVASQAMRIRDLAVVELLLLVLAFTGGYWLWRTYGMLSVSTWYVVPFEGSFNYTWAGYWLAFVSAPIARFLLLRWYFRLFIWYFFLWRVSRLKLLLNPLHPDRAGGLEFLAHMSTAFTPTSIGQSALLAGMIGNEILHEGAKLVDFQLEIAGFIAVMIMIMFFPMVFFSTQMLRARWETMHSFSLLASRYTHEFREKWLGKREPPNEALLGSSDIQSLADLANSFEVVRGMRLIPFNLRLVVQLAIAIALPLAPLVLTIISLDALLDRALALLL